MSLTDSPTTKPTQTWLANRPLIRHSLNGISLAAAICLLGIDLYVLLHVTINENFWIIAGMNNFGMWLLLASIPCLLIILAIPKARRFRALLALPAVVLLAPYAGFFLPKSAAPADPDFSIASFNATAEIDNPAFAPLRARAILALDADIIGIQEFDFPDRFIPLLQSTYPYYFTPADLIGTGRDMPYALFSRYPIDHENMQLIGDFPDRQRPVAARFIVTVNSQPISVYVMHAVKPESSVLPPSYDGAERRAGTLDVVNAVSQEPNPVIVLCDCNMSDLTSDYAALANVLHNSWRERGLGFGFTVPATPWRAPFPILRGDYIWHSASLEIATIAVGQDNGGSDHYPLIAQVIQQ